MKTTVNQQQVAPSISTDIDFLISELETDIQRLEAEITAEKGLHVQLLRLAGTKRSAATQPNGHTGKRRRTEALQGDEDADSDLAGPSSFTY